MEAMARSKRWVGDGRSPRAKGRVRGWIYQVDCDASVIN